MKTRDRWMMIAPLAAAACLGLAACDHNDDYEDRDYERKTSKTTKTETDAGTVKTTETTTKKVDHDHD